MLQISDSGQELQGTAQVKDPLPMGHHYLQAGDYYPTTLLVGSALFLTPGKAIWVGFG